MRESFSRIAIFLVVLVACSVAVQGSPADEAARVLQGWYNSGTGLWTTTGWWNSANALTALIQYSSRSRNHTYDSVIANTFAKHASYLNDYYDDEGWWALAWIEAYKYNKGDNYLKMAQTIFDDMAKGWDETCNGGIWWSKAKTYKNAIANELFLQVGSSLYILTGNSQYLQWAQKEWTWFNGTGMINNKNLINDGLQNCKNNGEAEWSYNQGVVLGGLINLFTATKDNAYLNQAEKIADATIANLVKDGILSDPPCGGGDCPQFKGVFMRNLGYLYEQTKDAKYSTFIRTNANSIWTRDMSGGKLGLIWTGPFDSADAARQSSALDALNANLLF